MELSFQKIELEDKALISSYLEQKMCRSCDLVFPNIYLWSRKYPTKYAVVEDTLIFQGIGENGVPSITFPAGGEEQAHKALDVMFQWFLERQADFRMHLVQEKEFELLDAWYPGRLQISYNRDIADYVYETEKLAGLGGKKLHGKRNHVNRFKENHPNWVYEPITEENVEDCFQMALKWREEMQCEIDVEKRDEMCVTLNALRLMEELELKGGLLRAEPQGEVIA